MWKELYSGIRTFLAGSFTVYKENVFYYILALWTARLPGGGVTFFIATPYGLLRGKRLLPCPVKRVFLFNDLSPKCHEGT